jgi:hypothetical protein
MINRKGSANQKVDILSRCPVNTSGVGGTTVITDKPLLVPESWLDVGAMEIDCDEDY